MSNEYAGLPAVAREYWRDYFVAFTGTFTLLLFTGSVTAVLVISFQPEAIWYFIIASTSFVLHFSALFLRDVWVGDYEPSQTTYSSARDLLAAISVIGTWFTVILLIATYGGYLSANLFDIPFLLTAGFSAYYAVVDTLLIRRGLYTPGAVTLLVTIILMNTAVNIHRSVIDALPVIGKRQGPHS